MTSHRWLSVPANVRSACAVVTLGVFVALVTLSGRAAGLRPVADAPVPAPVTAATAAVPDIASALTALGGPAPQKAAASRGERRTPVAHRWVRPYGGVFSSPFGYRWGRLHAGIDLAGPWGTPFVAATDGCIEYAGPMAGYGEVMRIRDWDGTETVYGHMSSFIRTSGCVRAGEPIARIGAGGDATGPHLHFEVRVGGVPVDPVPFLAKRGVYVR